MLGSVFLQLAQLLRLHELPTYRKCADPKPYCASRFAIGAATLVWRLVWAGSLRCHQRIGQPYSKRPGCPLPVTHASSSTYRLPAAETSGLSPGLFSVQASGPVAVHPPLCRQAGAGQYCRRRVGDQPAADKVHEAGLDANGEAARRHLRRRAVCRAAHPRCAEARSDVCNS